MDTRVFTDKGRDDIADEQANLINNVKGTGKIIAGGVLQSVTTAANIVAGDKTLDEAKESFTAPDKMADVIRQNPKVGAVLQAYQEGDYQGLLDNQQALQLLADSTGVSVDVIVTTVTNQMGKLGTTDNAITAIDVTKGNREDMLSTFGHEVVGHNLGGENETLADLSGVVTKLLVSAGMDSVQGKIDTHKSTLNDGVDVEAQQIENTELLEDNNAKLVEEMVDHPDEFMDSVKDGWNWLTNSNVGSDYGEVGKNDKSSDNSGSIATRFANAGENPSAENSILNSSNTTINPLVPYQSLVEGDQVNAMRHSLGTAVAAKFVGGKDAAKYMADHEGFGYSLDNIDNTRVFDDADDADAIVDLLNNKIGLDYQISHPEYTEKQLAIGLARVYNTSGLYEIVVTYDSRNNPTYNVKKKTISDDTFNKLKNSYEKHDNLGRW